MRKQLGLFTSLIFSGKAGAGITAELGTMSTQDQIQATRAMGVDPIEYLVVPRFLACCSICCISQGPWTGSAKPGKFSTSVVMVSWPPGWIPAIRVGFSMAREA